MVSPEKRLCERSDIFLIVEFKPPKYIHECCLGMTNNFSREGFNFESHYHDLHCGDVFEFTLKLPFSDISAAAVGEIVWKREGWYSRMSGVKLRAIDREAQNKILDFRPLQLDLTSAPSLSSSAAEPVDRTEEIPQSQRNTLQTDSTLHEKCIDESLVLLRCSDDECAGPETPDYPVSAAADDKAESAAVMRAGVLSRRRSRNVHESINRLFHRLLFSKSYRPCFTPTVTALLKSDDTTRLHAPTAFFVASMATLVLSIGFDLIRQDVSGAAAQKTEMSTESAAHVQYYQHTDPDLICEADAGTQDGASVVHDFSASRHLTEDPPQSLSREVMEEDRQYRTQVSAGNDFNHTLIIMSQLQQEYPAAYITEKNNFQIVPLPDAEPGIHGTALPDLLKKHYTLKPIISKKRIPRAAHTEEDRSGPEKRTQRLSLKNTGDTHQKAVLSERTAERTKRRIKPKNAYRKTASNDDAFIARDTGLHTLTESARKDELYSPIKKDFFSKTLHRKPGLIE